MAGHGLLPGCQRAWNHDGCPGYLRSPEVPGGSEDEIRMGGVACHCPCHRLTREIELHRQAAELTRTQLGALEAENLRLVEQAGEMAEQIEWLQEIVADLEEGLGRTQDRMEAPPSPEPELDEDDHE